MAGVGYGICRARADLHLPRGYVAGYLGISCSDVADMESGRRPVGVGEPEKPSGLFLVPEEILLEGTGARMPASLPADQIGEADWREAPNPAEFKRGLARRLS